VRRKALLSLQRRAHHQQRHDRANMFNGNLLAKPITAGFAVPHFILVIIVPRGVDTHLQQLGCHAFLPPGDGLRVGKVEVRPFVVPEAGALGGIGL